MSMGVFHFNDHFVNIKVYFILYKFMFFICKFNSSQITDCLYGLGVISACTTCVLEIDRSVS